MHRPPRCRAASFAASTSRRRTSRETSPSRARSRRASCRGHENVDGRRPAIAPLAGAARAVGLRGDSHNLFDVAGADATHVRLQHLSRRRRRAAARLRRRRARLGARFVAPDEIDLAAVLHGGRVVACSDMFFGSRNNLIMPGDARSMADGWETKAAAHARTRLDRSSGSARPGRSSVSKSTRVTSRATRPARAASRRARVSPARRRGMRPSRSIGATCCRVRHSLPIVGTRST